MAELFPYKIKFTFKDEVHFVGAQSLAMARLLAQIIAAENKNTEVVVRVKGKDMAAYLFKDESLLHRNID